MSGCEISGSVTGSEIRPIRKRPHRTTSSGQAIPCLSLPPTIAAGVNGSVALANTPNDGTDIHMQTEPASVAEIVNEVVASMRSEIDDRPLQMISDEKPSTAMIDRRLVKLAIKQLLGNALKYSPAERPILVQVQNADAMVTVAITDQGKGIPAPEQSRIFERLYRSPTVEHQIPGSGLGLSIALNIARAHHGNLTVTSRPGETTFRLMLPADRGGERK